MIKLFDENENYTNEASNIDIEFNKLIKSFIEKYSKDVFIRQLQYLMNQCVDLQCVLYLFKK
jgi:hypothetical protein